MIPNPILKVLSSMQTNGVKALLMGGQACVYYGGAEFSIDTDFAILADADNLARLQSALNDLQARQIAVPPFEQRFLERGHAIHFRCFHPECLELRVDVMAKMRGVDDFEILWERRTSAIDEELNVQFELMALPDLVRAKKTQCNKDWPMIQALLEAHYFQFGEQSTQNRIEFWVAELRTPRLLLEIAHRFPEIQTQREAALLALEGSDETKIEAALKREEERERELDRAYWAPLRAELEELRRIRRLGT